MKKHTQFLSIVTALLLFTCSSFASLSLVGVTADNNTKITHFTNPSFVWYEQAGQVDTYADTSMYDTQSHYLRSTYDVSLSDDEQWIHNSLTMNKYRYGTCQYVYDYSSAITFTVDQNEDDTAGIVVTTGDLYLNGSLLAPDEGTTDTYTVPTQQNLIATWDYYRSGLSGTSNSAYNVREIAPLVTVAQDIYLSGYTLPVPEPATIGLLGMGGLVTLIQKRRA